MHFRQRNLIAGSFATLAIALCCLNVSADTSTKHAIGPGKVVSLSYTVSLSDGQVVHSNVDGYPIKYKQGDGTLLPALEAALVGLAAGDEKSVTLPPEDIYGGVKDEAFLEVPIDQIPEDQRRVGAIYRPMGSRSSIRVAKINGDTALLDFNHPLAGKTLTYDVTILSVE